MEDIFNTDLELQEEQTNTETEIIDDLPADDAVLPTENPADNVVELTDELAEEHEAEQTEQKPKKEDKLSAYEKAVLAEMERRAEQGDTIVANALKSADKNIHECWQYITAQAKKKAVSGCAMIEDAVVFGWAHHYYIEPKAVIDAELHSKPKDKPKTDTKSTPEKGEETPKKPINPKDAGKSNPLLQKVGKGKKNAKHGNDKVYTKKVGDKTFTITEFALF